jgi:hypothetical protein
VPKSCEFNDSASANGSIASARRYRMALLLSVIGGIMRSLLFAITVVSTALLSFLKTVAVAAQPAVEDVKRCIEGVYVLEEFKKDGQVFRPPQIAGGWMVLNGVVMFIFHDRTQYPSK